MYMINILLFFFLLKSNKTLHSKQIISMTSTLHCDWAVGEEEERRSLQQYEATKDDLCDHCNPEWRFEVHCKYAVGGEPFCDCNIDFGAIVIHNEGREIQAGLREMIALELGYQLSLVHQDIKELWSGWAKKMNILVMKQYQREVY